MTASGTARYVVKYTLGGRGARHRYGGSFKTARDAQARRSWIGSELAARRVPDLSVLDVEPVKAPAFVRSRTGGARRASTSPMGRGLSRGRP
jgi:hypothetical protein